MYHGNTKTDPLLREIYDIAFYPCVKSDSFKAFALFSVEKDNLEYAFTSNIWQNTVCSSTLSSAITETILFVTHIF